MPRRRRREEIVSVSPLVRQLKEISLSQYFAENFMFYLVPLYCNVVIQDIDTGERKTFISKQNYVLLSERSDNEEIRIRLAPFSNELMSQYGIYVKHTPSILEPRIPQRLIDDIISNAVTIPNVSDVYTILRKLFEQYIDFPDKRLYVFMPIWVIGTYFYTMFRKYPYIYVTGMKHSGKTKNLELFEKVCYNAMFSTDISSASLFRVVEDSGATLLIDEAERIDQNLRKLLLSGYKSAGKAYRVEEVGGKKTVVAYNVFCPKAIANIEGLDEVLEDRCIGFTMLRGKNKQIILREVPETHPLFEKAKYLLYTLALTRWYELYKIFNEIQPPLELDGRTWELWKPIFAIAVWIVSDFLNTTSGSIVSRLKEYLNTPVLKDIYTLLVDKIREKQTIDLYENLDYMTVQALLVLVNRDDWYSISEIKNKIIELFIEDEKTAKKITTTKVGNILQKHLGIRKVKKVGNRRYFYIMRQHIEDVAIRLGINIEVIQQQLIANSSEETVVVIRQVERLDNPQQGICEFCGENKTLVAKVEGRYICSDCLSEIQTQSNEQQQLVISDNSNSS